MAIVRLTDHGVETAQRKHDEEISLDAWRNGVRPEAGRFALSVPNDQDVEAIADIVQQFSTVILEFPVFGDGRAYSQAQILRSRLGFAGEIRARGDILCDQALFLARCGVDALDIGDRDAAAFRDALSAYTVFYQTAADGAPAAHRLRRGRAKAA